MKIYFLLFSCCSVAHSRPTLCNPIHCCTPGFPVLHHPGGCSNSCSSSWWCHPTISSSVTRFSSCRQSFLSIGVLSSESALCIRWPKYWSFSFSISISDEHSGLISHRFDLLAVQETIKSLLQHHSSKASILWCSAFFTVQLSHPYMTTEKP